MRFYSDPNLMIDEKTSDFGQRVQDNDYVLYEQKIGYWERVPKTTHIFSQKRVKGLRRLASFTVILENGDVLLWDGQSLIGEISVIYTLVDDHSKLLALRPNEMSEMVFADLKKELRSMVRSYDTADFDQKTVGIHEELEKTIDNSYGYQLSVGTAQVIALIKKVRATAQANIAEQAVYDEYQLDLENRRRLYQIKIDYERLLTVEKAKLELEAEHIKRLKLIDEEMAVKEQRRLLEKLQYLLQIPPELIPPVISLLDPNSASALSQILGSYSSHAQFEKLLDVIRPNSMPPLLPTSGRVMPSLQDPIVTKLREIAGVRDVTKQDSDYLISVDEPPFHIHLQILGNKVTGVLYGSSSNPRSIWKGDLSGDVVTVAQRVITDIRNRRR